MKFKELRQKKNILQKDIAKFLGITPATYSRYENGIMEPSYDIVIK
ncbi:MAG: helix-turn-helix transcriptional regulator [Clostridiales bacterium]|nr:helix-turn-helix transcriptional regulator [Clostridiales bacterium]